MMVQSSFGLNSLLLFLMLMYPLLGLLWHHQYPIYASEVMLLAIAIAAIAGLISLGLGACSPLVAHLALVTLLTLVLLVHVNLLFLSLLVVFFTGLGVSFILGEKFRLVLLAMMAALIAGAWFDSRIDIANASPPLTVSHEGATQGPIIHILLDGFMSPDGLPETDEAQDLRSHTLGFFRDHDFHLFTRAYSHYGSTLDSMTRAFNFRNDSENLFQRSVMLREPMSIPQNAWFNTLGEHGYPVAVYQTESIDFCAPDDVIHCEVFTMPNLKSIRGEVRSIGTRALVLLRTILAQSVLLNGYLQEAVGLGSWGVSAYDRRLLASLARDVQQAPGLAFFAHVLIPHPPLVYSEDCSLDYDSELWQRFTASTGDVGNSDESRRVRYRRYIPQALCALRELELLFAKLREHGIYRQATIVVHGDHGSSAFNYPTIVSNKDKLTYRDLRESYSTLFAIKYPNGDFSINDQVLSLDVLMARALLRITGKSAEELGLEAPADQRPFIYLSGVMPLAKEYVNVFTRNGPDEGEP